MVVSVTALTLPGRTPVNVPQDSLVCSVKISHVSDLYVIWLVVKSLVHYIHTIDN